MSAIALRVMAMVLRSATPEIVKGLRDGIDDLEARAKRTPNPVDDLLVAILREIVG